ncbi:hypothetical protein [Aquimarina algiphila]|uniref:Uncharacterized protein n=1 Tax=Aquimarina algiphila TaxID=2047982 RepID=A0A554VP26_9FLAO|nr:hypothetical protein [Aquimarina algiphila]TSE10158.1 hypothetical protein FOF46_05300 [Aquimarina algiphila]
MLKKEIHDKNRVLPIQHMPNITYERNVFNLLQINPDHFDQCVQNNKTYALLLRNWVEECLEQNTPVKTVAKKIKQSGVLHYMELKPKLKFAI